MYRVNSLNQPYLSALPTPVAEGQTKHFTLRDVLCDMSEEVQIRNKDTVSMDVLPDVVDFYSNLGSEWSKAVPRKSQHEAYEPHRIQAHNGGIRNDTLRVNISCYRELDTPSFFLGITATPQVDGDVEIEAYLVLVPERGVVAMQDPEHGCPERRHILIRRSVATDCLTRSHEHLSL